MDAAPPRASTLALDKPAWRDGFLADAQLWAHSLRSFAASKSTAPSSGTTS